MDNKYLVRQMDMIPEKALATSLTIIGAGAVGSVASLFLAKMGYVNQTVYDFDVIDNENMNCQMYKVSQVGKAKTDALAEIVNEYTGCDILTQNSAFTKEMVFNTEIVCVPVDSIDVRKDLFKSFMASPVSRYLIDTRMAIEFGEIYVVDKQDKQSVDVYISSLHDASEAVEQRCTNKSVMYTSSIIAGVLCKAVKDITTNVKPFKRMIYNISLNDCIFI